MELSADRTLKAILVIKHCNPWHIILEEFRECVLSIPFYLFE